MAYPKVKVFIHVLDDDDDDLEFLSLEFKKHGELDFKLFNHSKDFLEATKRGTHIVVLDYQLDGDKNGAEVVKELLEENPACFCIMQSGQSNPDVIIDCVNAGIRGYIKKGDDNYLERLVQFVGEKKAGAQKVIERHYEDMLSLIRLEESIDKLQNEL